MEKLSTLAMLVVISASIGSAQQASVTASDAWIAEPTAGAASAPAYLVVSNPTMYDIYIVSATTTAAEKVELRDGSDRVVKEITVASYGSAELKAGDAHLMLVNLKRALKAGETVDLLLKTDGGVSVAASAVIKRP